MLVVVGVSADVEQRPPELRMLDEDQLALDAADPVARDGGEDGEGGVSRSGRSRIGSGLIVLIIVDDEVRFRPCHELGGCDFEPT